MSHISELRHGPFNCLEEWKNNNLKPFRCISHPKQKIQDDYFSDGVDNELELNKVADAADTRKAHRCRSRSVSSSLGVSADGMPVGECKGTFLDAICTDNTEGSKSASKPVRSMSWEASTLGNQDVLSNAKMSDQLLPRSTVHHLTQLLIQCVREDEKLLFLAQLASLEALRNLRTLELYFQDLDENLL
ncbi:unnamed protein product [Phytomonas sp. Hart1]|nr:unnamed protein product [Phytomonas sp. Hart1]|eukprot:CCW68269.1 unnamed protein product [Phytomonas sp. isolate Hart1]